VERDKENEQADLEDHGRPNGQQVNGWNVPRYHVMEGINNVRTQGNGGSNDCQQGGGFQFHNRSPKLRQAIEMVLSRSRSLSHEPAWVVGNKQSITPTLQVVQKSL